MQKSEHSFNPKLVMLTSSQVFTAVSTTLLVLTTAYSAESCPNSTFLKDASFKASSTTQSETSNNSKISRSPNSSITATKVALANHLKQLGAKFYGTFWCPYCSKQKQMFGEQAFSKINYIECDARGNNPRPNLCIKAGISAFPTWEINGKQYRGMKSLEELADLSGYQGDRNFAN